VGLPDTYDEFVADLLSEKVDVVELARAFDVLDRCFCGEPIVDDDAFVESVAHHYDVDVDNELYGALFETGVCCANPDHPNLCSYHAHQADRDD
jgi:hypothetical protein